MFDLPVDTEGQKGHTGYLEKSYSGRLCNDSIFGIRENMSKQRVCNTIGEQN